MKENQNQPELFIIMKSITEELWIQYSNKLKAFILSRVHNEAVADDILQETFIKVHAKIDQIKDDTKIQKTCL